MKQSGCSPSRGIGADGLVRAAEKLGFRAQIKDGADLADIDEWVNQKKIPVIVDWFAFEGGHYSVVSGIDRENIYLEDPSLGHRRAMQLNTFKRLWFDFPHDYLRSRNDLIIRRMIVIENGDRHERYLHTDGYYAELRKLVTARRDVALTEHRLATGTGTTAFFRIASRDISRNDKVMLIRAGIHGDEVAGPLTIIHYFNRIFDAAHRRGIKVIVYPLGNPVGFDARERYHGDASRDAVVNNDFIRYELASGDLVDDIRSGARFKRWYWSSDRRLDLTLPAETALMHHLLKRDPLPGIVAAVDLHQDLISSIDRPAAYHYAFGELAVYRRIVDAVSQTVPLLANQRISAGQASAMRTNTDGFIVRHDGTLGDLMHRLGVPFTVTVETTGRTPLDRACQVNWTWIKGLLDLSARKRTTIRRSYSREVVRPLKATGNGHRLVKTGRIRTDAGVHPIYAAVTRNIAEDLPRVILTAGIHGEEQAGVYALIEFLERGMVKYWDHFSFLILPCINPYGFVRGVRGTGDALDLNRSFGEGASLPEVAAVKDLLRRFPGPYRCAIDLHETDSYLPKGADRSVEDHPTGFYVYETTRNGHPLIGPTVIRTIRRAGHPITRRRSVYGVACRDGLVYSGPPESPDYPDLPEFTGTLDWHLLQHRYTDHYFATETPTAWPLKRRMAVQKKALAQALKVLRQAP